MIDMRLIIREKLTSIGAGTSAVLVSKGTVATGRGVEAGGGGGGGRTLTAVESALLGTDVSLGTTVELVEATSVALESVGVSICFRLALAAARRAASLSCRITLRIRRKNA